MGSIIIVPAAILAGIFVITYAVTAFMAPMMLDSLGGGTEKNRRELGQIRKWTLIIAMAAGSVPIAVSLLLQLR